MAVILTRMIITALATRTLPESVRLAGTPTNFVYVLDLGIVIPLAFLSAVWLWRRLPLGLVVAGAVLIKLAAAWGSRPGFFATAKMTG